MQLLLKYFRLNLLPSKVSHEKGVENPVKLTRSFNSLSTKITALSQPKTKGRSEVRQKGLFFFFMSLLYETRTRCMEDHEGQNVGSGLCYR